MVHLIRNRLTNPSSASCESLEGTVTETTVKGPEPDDLDPDECGSDVDIDEEDMETFNKGDGVFWAKTTHRYVAKYKRETLRFPVGKKLKGHQSRRLAAHIQHVLFSSVVERLLR